MDLPTIITQYEENADWEATRDVTKAGNFVTACTLLIPHLGKTASAELERDLDPEMVYRMMVRASTFLAAVPPAGEGASRNRVFSMGNWGDQR